MNPSAKLRIIGLSILALVGLAGSVSAQTGTLTPSPFQYATDGSGKVINNACVWTYVAGTTTNATTYTDKALSTPNLDPIRSASDGRFVAYLVPGNSYKFVFETSCVPPAHGTVLRTQDNVDAVPLVAANVDLTTPVAGEAISAGNCVYLSDGSGGKIAGEWYKCDSANLYSSTQPEVGIAPSAIASAASGTVRLTGEVTGLSSLSVGSDYFIGTAGAITTTAPSNARYLGRADSATSLVLSPNPRLPVANNSVADGRLTLTTGVPVTTADVTAATTLYYTPYTGTRIALYDGTAVWNTRIFSELSIAVPATTSQMYDVFVYDNSGTATLELLAWTNDTTRATALVRQDGRLVKSGATTRLYVGSFRTTTVSGQTEDSLTKRYVWNYYNRRPRALRRLESTATWSYSTATWRQANAAAANQVELVVGQVEDELEVSVQGFSTAATVFAGAVAVGEDSTTAPLATQLGYRGSAPSSGNNGEAHSTWKGYPNGVGYHKYVWLEIGDAGTDTWQGVSSNSWQAGIHGTWQG